MKHVKVHDPQDPVIRVQFAVGCVHWDHEQHGKVRNLPGLSTLSACIFRIKLIISIG
jgi:hypothetical protein